MSPPSASDPKLTRGDRVARCVIILGMHRSGTSAVTGTLEQAGIFLGDVGLEAPDNRKGNREPPLLNVLHEELLAANEGSWNRPVAPLRWDRIHRTCRDLFIAQFDGRPIWGFKDPRTVLALAEWLTVLPQAELVGVFRHPEDVARSLRARDAMTLDDGLELWMFYNRVLLWWADQRRDLRMIEFDRDPAATAVNLARLVESLELPGSEATNRTPFYDPGLVGSRARLTDEGHSNDSPRRSQALALYRRLQDRARRGLETEQHQQRETVAT